LATTTQRDNFKQNIERIYIQSIVRHLADRFPNVEVIDTFNTFNPQSMPTGEEAYGQEKLQWLLTMFSEDPNAELDSFESNREWEGMRRLIHTR